LRWRDLGDTNPYSLIITSALLLGMEAIVGLTEDVPDWQAIFTRGALLVVLLTFSGSGTAGPAVS